MKNLIEELQWRGLVQDIIPETEQLLMKEKVSGYIGFDPTSDSLHIGSLVPIILLMHLQKVLQAWWEIHLESRQNATCFLKNK